jgi:hypothetical protein
MPNVPLDRRRQLPRRTIAALVCVCASAGPGRAGAADPPAGTPFEARVKADDPALREEIARQTLSTEELSKIPGTLGDPLRAIENLPGAARPPLNTGLFIIEGARPSDSRVYLGAAEVPQLYHYGGFTSVVPAGFIASIDYMPHNFGVRYGRATAGTIDVDLRAGRRDRWHGALDANIVHLGLEAEGPIGPKPKNKDGQGDGQRPGSLLLGVRRSYVDATLALGGAILGDPPGLHFVNAPVYWDYQAVLNYPVGGGQLRVMALGSDDQITLRFARPQDVDPSVNGQFATHILFHRLAARYKRRVHGWDLLLQNTTGYSSTELSLGRSVSLTIRTVSSDSRLEARRDFGGRYQLLFGADIQSAYVYLDAAVPAPVREGEFQRPPGALPQVTAAEEAGLCNPGFYAELTAKPVDRLSLTGGLRFDYFSLLHRWTLDPRLVGRVQLTRLTTLKFGAGLYAQDPAAQDYFSGFGNDQLRLERAAHFSLAVEQAVWRGLMVEVTGIYKYLWDFAGTSTYQRRFGDGPQPQLSDIRPEKTANLLTGRIYGATLLLRQHLSKYLFGWLSYSLLRSERRDCDTCDYRLFDYDQTHILILAVHVYLPYKFEAGVRFRYITGIPLTPVRGGYYDSDTDLYQPVPGAPNSARLGDFHQLDLRIDRKFTFKRWSLTAYLDISNIYNHAAPEQAVYSYDYTQRGALTGLPILPSLGMRGEL